MNYYIRLFLQLLITVVILIYVSTLQHPVFNIIRKILSWAIPIIILTYVWSDVLRDTPVLL